jgi:hypothetical protein
VTEPEAVGSLAQETARLLHALAAEARKPAADGTGTADAGADGMSAGATAGEHVCTTGWCPICQVVGFVHEHPEVVEQVTDAAVQLGRTVRDMLEQSLAAASTTTEQPTDEA